jgi:hypothetical protein
VQTASDDPNLSAYAVLEPNGYLDLMVIPRAVGACQDVDAQEEPDSEETAGLVDFPMLCNFPPAGSESRRPRVDSRPGARLRSPAVAPGRSGARSGFLRPGSRAVAGED